MQHKRQINANAIAGQFKLPLTASQTTLRQQSIVCDPHLGETYWLGHTSKLWAFTLASLSHPSEMVIRKSNAHHQDFLSFKSTVS